MKAYLINLFAATTFLMVTVSLNGQNIADESEIKEKPKKDTTHSSLKCAIYTDFKGFSGDYPNGLVQTTLEGDFILNINEHTINFFRNIHCGINLTKLEDNLRYKNLLIGYDST